MNKIKDIWISGWCIFARLLYFTIISSVLLVPVKIIPLTFSSFIKNEAVYLVISLFCMIVFVPFICYLAFKITKLLGPQISFPIMCPKCGSFVERKDSKQE